MDYQEAIYCMKAMAEEAVCEECNFYHSCDHSKQADMARIAISAMQELQQYKQLGTLEEVREAVEKQHPEEPMRDCVYKHQTRWCAKCKRIVIRRWKHCPICGQKLDWSEKDD